MPFKKGQSGNPGGHSKEKRAEEAEFKAIIDQKTNGPVWFVNKLMEFVQFGSDHAIKLKATLALMEYRIPKPKQQIDVEVSGTIELASAIEKARKRANQSGA